MGLINHLSQVHTTPLGEVRIRKNLQLEDIDVVEYCKKMMLNPDSQFVRKGKNWYCTLNSVCITINASSYTIITAHLIS